MKSLWLIVLAGVSLALQAEDDPGWEPIFDGQSLAGWETPDASYWSVEDGAITARISPTHACRTNQYLVWKGGELADFELKLKSRVNGDGGINNGFQFRSRLLPDHDICGYQVDNNLQTDWLVRLYDEYGRHTLAWRGENAVFNAEGERTATKLPESGGLAWFRLEEWHEYHLKCVESKLTLWVNGRLAASVEDNDSRRFEPQGILALQLHGGAPTVAQFKDIRLKVVQAARAARTQEPAGRAALAALRREAVAFWPLDTGGHGASPHLRHVPEWEKFELNVRETGPGARTDANVVLLHGAYFDAGPDVKVGREQITVYLRVRDPKGTWNSGLLAKGASASETGFSLFGSDLPATPGPDIGFMVQTDQQKATVSFPVSVIDPKAWHNLVGCYDGKTLEVYCDGKRLAEQACTGALVQTPDRMLIGAESEGGRVVRRFEGEMEEAALWPRALTANELQLLGNR